MAARALFLGGECEVCAEGGGDGGDEVACCGWGDGVSGHADEVAAAGGSSVVVECGVPVIIAGEGHSGGYLVGFEHPEHAVVDERLGCFDVARCDE